MQNYSKKTALSQARNEILSGTGLQKNTWLHISFSDDISSELGNVIPFPHHHYMSNNKIVYCWLIDGFFDTLKGIQFLNDIIARFKITFETSQYLKHTIDTESTLCPLKLKAFQNLKSRAVQKIIQNSRYDGTRDFIFYCLKLHAELIIKEKGIFSYDELEDFATQLIQYKTQNLRPSLDGFKSAIALGLTNNSSNKDLGVCLSTVHTMKGQESEIVFLIGMDDGTFPDFRAINKGGEELQQEKNNAYVAFTRAKRFLYVTYPKNRLMPWGDYKARTISRFLKFLI